MKVIFLDIDGVLNTIDTFKRIREEYKKTGIYELEIDSFRVEYLKRIIDNTNAKIVLSSCWRIFWKKDNNVLIPIRDQAYEFEKILNKYNLEIFDITGKDKNRNRGNEIKEWLNNNEVESFIIIDDETYDLEDLKEYVIKTRENKIQIGLLEKHIEICIEKLNNNKKLILKP